MSITTTPPAPTVLWLRVKDGQAACLTHTPDPALKAAVNAAPLHATHRTPAALHVRVDAALVAAGAPAVCGTCQAPARTLGAVL